MACNLDRFTAMIRETKARSTAWLKNEFPECKLFKWQDGYGSFSVSYSQLERTREYIMKQEEHHATQSFEAEYLLLLNRHSAKFDDRYIFD